MGRVMTPNNVKQARFPHRRPQLVDAGRQLEVVRVLDGLQTDELCPCNWQKGEDTLKAVRAKGGAVTREAGPVKGGTTVIAFVTTVIGTSGDILMPKRTWS